MAGELAIPTLAHMPVSPESILVTLGRARQPLVGPWSHYGEHGPVKTICTTNYSRASSSLEKGRKSWDFPGGLLDKTQRSQCRGPEVRSLVRELDPTCCN